MIAQALAGRRVQVKCGFKPSKSKRKNVVSAMSLTRNGNREYACSEAYNSAFRVDLFRSKGKLHQKTCSDLKRPTIFLFLFFECNSSEFNADPAGRLETRKMNKLQGKIRNTVILGIQSLVEWSQRSLFFIRKRVIPLSSIPSLPHPSQKVQYS